LKSLEAGMHAIYFCLKFLIAFMGGQSGAGGKWYVGIGNKLEQLFKGVWHCIIQVHPVTKLGLANKTTAIAKFTYGVYPVAGARTKTLHKFGREGILQHVGRQVAVHSKICQRGFIAQ